MEPLIWAVMCAAAIAMCWSKIRSGGWVVALVCFVFAMVFVVSGWNAFTALLAAMEATAAGAPVAKFRETIFIAGPLYVTLGWPFARTILAGVFHHGKDAHGSA